MVTWELNEAVGVYFIRSPGPKAVCLLCLVLWLFKLGMEDFLVCCLHVCFNIPTSKLSDSFVVIMIG